MNKRTLALTDSQYIRIIFAIKGGFSHNGIEYKPNERISTALALEANLGLRISDIINLRYCDIVRDGERFRLDIVEIKTEKARTFTVPAEIREFINDYRIRKGIAENDLLFNLSERAIQKHLKAVCDYLGFDGIITYDKELFIAFNKLFTFKS